MNRKWQVTLLWFGWVTLLAVYLASSFRVTTDISEFLPRSEDSLRNQLVREVASGQLSRRMIVTIEAPPEGDAAAISRAFEALLREDEAWFARLESFEAGSDAQSDEALWGVYAERWPYFFAKNVEAAHALIQDDGLEEAAENLLQQLQQPMSALVSRVAPNDPFLVLPQLFEGLAASQAGTIRVIDGRFTAEDGRYAVFFLSTHAGAFENAEQRPVLTGMYRAFDRLNAQYDGKLRLEMSGVNRMSIAAQESIEGDIRRISILSTVFLSLLLFLMFRGPRVAGLALMSIVTGVLSALAVSTLIFGRVHGISLAFGASLIGLAVDYVIHLYSHHAEGGDGGTPQQTLRRILPALGLASSTALIGFFVLGYTGFPGLREVAVFAVVGLSAALATVALVVVQWVPLVIPPTKARTWLADRLMDLLATLRSTRWVAIGLFGVVALVIAVGLPRVQWSAGLIDMGSLDGELMEEESRVRSRVSRFEQSRFIASYGSDLETALQSAEAVRDLLDASDLAVGYASISGLLPSQQRQIAVADVLRHDATVATRFAEAFSKAGFRPEMFNGFYRRLSEPLPDPVVLATLVDTPLAALAENFVVPLEQGFAVLSFLYQVHDSDQLAKALNEVPGAIYIDQASMMRDIGASQRGRTVWVLLIGMAGIVAILWLRYRRWRQVFGVIAPSLFAVAWTWSVLALLGYPADLITLSASLMIVSLGVDYGVFLVDSAREKEAHLRAALLGVAAAGATTLLGFGLLAVSSYPVLFRIGLTALIGVSAAMVLAPIALVLARAPEKKG